jgi:tetratricopeptide (TPR) repeat protein
VTALTLGCPWAVAQVRPVAPSQNAKPAPEGKAAVDAVRELEVALKKSPRDARVHVLLGLAYWNRGDLPRGLELFQRAVELAPDSSEAHNWLGVALLDKSDFPNGIAALRKAVTLDPKYGRAWSNLGSALAKSGELDEAVEVFQKALALEPNGVGAHLNLGMALREKGDLEAALDHLQRVVTAEPENPGIQYEYGRTLRQSGDLKGAIASFEKALALNPELREGYYALGQALKEQSAAGRKPVAPAASQADDLIVRARDAVAGGDLNAARGHLTAALQTDDANAQAQTLLGFVLGQQGDPASALRHLEKAVALQPDLAEARYNLGAALWFTGTRDRALAELRQSVVLDPSAGAAYAFLGMALRESGQLDEARVALQRAIALLPPTTAIYVDLGITFLRTGELDKALGQIEAGLNAPSAGGPTPDWDAAIAGLREAAGRHADRADVHNTLGLVLGRKGANGNDVVAAFRDAVRLRPDYAEAHNNLGLVLIQSGDDAGGIAALREAVRLAPDYVDALTNLGAALTPTDTAAAILHLEKAAALAPGSVNAQFNLAMAYGASTDHGVKKEIEQLRKVAGLAPAFARAHLALGKALLRDGQLPDAVKALEEAVRLDPQVGEAHYQLGLALNRAGRREDAAAALKKGRELVSADDRQQNAALDIAEGRAALEAGNLPEAVAKFQLAIKRLPESAEAHRHLGEALEKQGDAAGASAAYEKALELNPGAGAARQGLDRLAASRAAAPSTPPTPGVDDPVLMAELEGYVRDGRFTEVEPLLVDYVGKRPKSSWGWYALGYSYYAQKKIGESIKALAKSLQLDVKNAEAHKILGRNLMIIGRFDAAQIEFEQGIRYKPDSAELHYNLGRLHSIQDNWEPARKSLEAALRIDPDYVEAVDGLGFALEALGDDEGAVAHYQRAVALNEAKKGTFDAPHVNLSAYYNRTGDAQKAREHALKALGLDPRSDRALFQKAKADERDGRLDDAVDALNRAIVVNPRASSYYYVLAGVYRKMGWDDESRKALEVFKKLEQESSELEKKRRSAGSAAPGAPMSGRSREQAP